LTDANCYSEKEVCDCMLYDAVVNDDIDQDDDNVQDFVWMGTQNYR
jgi:isopentenyldiphosphate isomerase